MAHLIAKTKDGKDAIAWTGETPWHGLGQMVESAMTAEKAMALSGICEAIKDAHKISVEGGLDGSEYKAVVRRDTKKVLAIVNDSYEIIQDSEAFSFMDSMVGAGQAVYEVAGMLDGGRKTWMLMKVPGTIKVGGTDGDEIKKYLLGVNSHDGTSALRYYFTTVRVICDNTLHMSYRDASSGIAIRHTKNYEERMKQAETVLKIAKKNYDDFGAHVNQLAAFKLTKEQFEKYIGDVLPGESTRAENQKEVIEYLAEHGKGTEIDGVKGSLWGALNAVTEYVDWYRPTRGTSDENRLNNRLRSVWLGSGAQIKAKALDKAIALVNA